MYDNFEEKYKVPIKVHPLLADLFYSRFFFLWSVYMYLDIFCQNLKLGSMPYF